MAVVATSRMTAWMALEKSIMLASDEVPMFLQVPRMVKVADVSEEVLVFVDDVFSVGEVSGSYFHSSQILTLVSGLLHIPVFDDQRR